MITHNILIKLKDRNSESIGNVRDKLLSMKDKIESLRDLKVKVNIRQDGSSYDILQIAQYDSMEDLEAYIVHPVHIEVSRYMEDVIDSIAVVCYES
jgi:hypothetical protein